LRSAVQGHHLIYILESQTLQNPAMLFGSSYGTSDKFYLNGYSH
jgi:hypothetical protein